ncbi:MAG: LPS assembly protein LptD [Acidobacteriia bacterium]|nr:LPS assembly protein LptD [Terriglobia bacterium]
MTLRSRFLTTALLLCHLLLLPRLVTSEALAGAVSSQASAVGEPQPQTSQEPSTADRRPSTAKPHLATPNEPGEEITIQALQQEKVGDMYYLRGEVEIRFRCFVLRADEITYNAASGELTAEGHLVFDGGPHDEHLEADHGAYNVRTDSGKFYEVRGTTGARFRGRQVLLTSSNPFFFSGALVEKDGPDHFVVHHGVVTSCELPHPKWTFEAQRITVDVGEEARMYHSTFRLGGVPIFYFPYVRHPVDKLGRQTGFLIPTIGQSSSKGTILGDAIYWAISPSMDATLGAEYYSHRGWAQHGAFRARPSDTSYFNLNYFGVLDRGIGSPKVDQGGEDIRANGEVRLPHGFRAVADIDYLSSFVFRLGFAETFTLAVNSEVRSNAFVSHAYQGYFFNLAASRYQNFQSTTRGDLVTILHAPSLDLGSVDHPLGRSPFYWSYDAAVQGVSRREPQFVTAPLVGRLDVEPRLSLPLNRAGWSFRPEVALRDTYYTQRLATTGVPQSGIGALIDRSLNRRALEITAELRPPSLSRIFEKKVKDHILKHTIEPRVIYRYVAGVDNFPAIIRFDARDILSNTSELEFGMIHRLYAKGTKSTECVNRPEQPPEEAPPSVPLPAAPEVAPRKGKVVPVTGCQPGPPASREILSWEIAQKYFFDTNFDDALVPGRRNVFTTTAEFSGIAFLTDPRRFSPIISRLRAFPGHRTEVEWKLDYDTKKGLINASTALVSHRFGDFFVAGSHAFLNVPGEIFVSTPVPGPSQFNQFRWLVGYGHPNKRGVSAAANVGFDINSGFLQYSAFQTSYNWDCCGVSFEYRRFALGSVRNENQFRFALSLTNVGTFGTLRRQERLF